jgi:arylformamidase
MTKWIYLSYLLDQQTPAYGGAEGLQVETVRTMANGDSCNAAFWSLPNHLGTHIDFPRHFSAEGRAVGSYPADFWIFRSVQLCELDSLVVRGEIGIEDFNLTSLSADTDLLLLKTGFGSYRNSSLYWEKSPVFSQELADALRLECTRLRVFGFDAISVSSWSARSVGRLAHKAFLDNYRPIMLLEDLDLSQLSNGASVEQVIISPLRVSGADGTPCTVFAEVVG